MYRTVSQGFPSIIFLQLFTELLLIRVAKTPPKVYLSSLMIYRPIYVKKKSAAVLSSVIGNRIFWPV